MVNAPRRYHKLHHQPPHQTAPLRNNNHSSPPGGTGPIINDMTPLERRNPPVALPRSEGDPHGLHRWRHRGRGTYTRTTHPNDWTMHKSQYVTLGVSHASSTSRGIQTPRPREHPGRQWENTYTFSQPLPNLEEAHALPRSDTPSQHDSPRTAAPPSPIPWTPRFLPEEWVYIDGSYIKSHPRLGAAVVHTSTCTTISIDAAGSEESRTIMRAELVAIHTALTRFEDHS